MYTISAKKVMSPRAKPETTVYVNLSLRLGGEEAERYDEVLRRAFNRNPRANKTDVVRRLFDLDADTDGLVTEQDRLYFQGKKQVRKPGAPSFTIDVGDAPKKKKKSA